MLSSHPTSRRLQKPLEPTRSRRATALGHSSYTQVAWLLCFLLSCTSAFAEGDETLGPPSISLATGTGIVGAGVGLSVPGVVNGSGTLSIDIPAGASVQQLLMYWGGFHSTPTNSDNTATVNGTPIVGAHLGGPTLFVGSTYCSAYRADITSVLSLTNGSNVVTVSGLSYDLVTHGVSLIAIIDDGTALLDLQLVDGVDLAYANFLPPLDATVPQTFDFVATSQPRTATVQLVVSDVESHRPSVIRVTSGGIDTDHVNLLGSTAGPEWDHVAIDVTVPAGASSVTVEVISQGDGSPIYPSSFAWLAATCSIEAPSIAPPTGEVSGTLWLDANGDGVEDSGEVGISDVSVLIECAGPDGLLDTADDYVDGQLTGPTGDYLFDNLPLGPCRVAIDVSSSPPGVGAGVCPLEIDLGVGQGIGAGAPIVATDTDFCLAPVPLQAADFVRGDTNGDGVIDVADIVFVAKWAAAVGVVGTCSAAADTNRDLSVDIADAVYLASYLFAAGAPPAAPFASCGQGGPCDSYAHCP